MATEYYIIINVFIPKKRKHITFILCETLSFYFKLIPRKFHLILLQSKPNHLDLHGLKT